MLMFRFMTLTLLIFFELFLPDSCLAVTLRRRITRHADRRASCRDEECSSHIGSSQDYLVMVSARRTIRPFKEAPSPNGSNLPNQDN